MHEGMVVEQGTHAQLMRKEGGVYAKLVAHQQASGAVEDSGEADEVRLKLRRAHAIPAAPFHTDMLSQLPHSYGRAVPAAHSQTDMLSQLPDSYGCAVLAAPFHANIGTRVTNINDVSEVTERSLTCAACFALTACSCSHGPCQASAGGFCASPRLSSPLHHPHRAPAAASRGQGWGRSAGGRGEGAVQVRWQGMSESGGKERGEGGGG
jgi:hypothetical protein